MNNSQGQVYEPEISQQIAEPYPEILVGEINQTTIPNKPIQNLNLQENLMASSIRYPKTISKNSPIHAPPQTGRNISFSDIISPQNVHTVVNMSLEKELENNVRKSLNTMSDRSNFFEQSSIHKDENNKAEAPSGFDLKEHDSLLNDNPVNEVNNPTNKRVCILCHNSQEAQAGIIGSKPAKDIENVLEYDLIYPCLCNIKAHRECLKSYMLVKQVICCERCKTEYALSGKTMREITLPKENRIVMTVAALICLTVAIAGVIILVNSFGGTQAPLGIVGIVLVILGILGIGYLAWRKYLSKKIVDVAVHCKQTEIARHRQNPEQTLKKFLEQEQKRSSRVLKRAKKIFGLLEPTEFENYIKMTTPRTEKQEKVPNQARHGSSNLLGSDPSKQKENSKEESVKKAKKEIFIAPTEVEKSENTIPDNPSNVNEHPSKAKNRAIPQIRIADSKPSKHVENNVVQKQPPPKPSKPEIRHINLTGSQSERKFRDGGKKPQPSRLVKLTLKETAQSVTTREKEELPYFGNDRIPPKKDFDVVQRKELDQD